MGFEDHPAVETPRDNTPIWRYMDFAKFVWTIQRSKLHFHRPDLFNDPFEGSMPEEAIELRRKAQEADDRLPDDADERIAEGNKAVRGLFAVNC